MVRSLGVLCFIYIVHNTYIALYKTEKFNKIMYTNHMLINYELIGKAKNKKNILNFKNYNISYMITIND